MSMKAIYIARLISLALALPRFTKAQVDSRVELTVLPYGVEETNEDVAGVKEPLVTRATNNEVPP